jgi:hypothetical protein
MASAPPVDVVDKLNKEIGAALARAFVSGEAEYVSYHWLVATPAWWTIWPQRVISPLTNVSNCSGDPVI